MLTGRDEKRRRGPRMRSTSLGFIDLLFTQHSVGGAPPPLSSGGVASALVPLRLRRQRLCPDSARGPRDNDNGLLVDESENEARRTETYPRRPLLSNAWRSGQSAQ